MQKYIDAVLTSSGTPAAGASVSVTVTATGLPATIYSDNGATVIVGSTVTADASGEYAFYAANGRYTLTISYSGYAAEVRTDVLLFDPADAIPVSVKDFGAKGDSSANDRAAFAAALANGGSIFVPAGTYRIEFSTTDALTTIANTVIEGEGRHCTELVFAPDSATYRNLITMGGAGLTIKGLKIRIEEAGVQSIAVINAAHSRLTVQDCEIDGGITDNGVSVTHSVYAFSYPTSGTQNDHQFVNNEIYSCTYGFLKSNASTSVQRRMRIQNNDFHDIYICGPTLNSPNGVCEDVEISGNNCYDTGLITAGLFGNSHIGMALASVSNARLTSNTLDGAFYQAIHVEENCQGVVIAKNTIYVDGTGVAILDNNIAGSSVMPEQVSIEGNTIRKKGTAKGAGSYGVWLITDATPEVPAKNVIVSGNVIADFEVGIGSDCELADGCAIKVNEIDNCTYGIRDTSTCPDISGNTTRACTTDYYSDIAGVLRNHTFVDSATPVDAISRPVTLINPTFAYTPISISAGVTSYRALFSTAANDRCYGHLHYKVWASESVNDYADEAFEVTWDGATFTATQKYSRQPGGLSVAAVQNSSNLALSLFNANNRTCRVVAQFIGSASIAV